MLSVFSIVGVWRRWMLGGDGVLFRDLMGIDVDFNMYLLTQRSYPQCL
jgi:hypothetical protein